MLTDKNVLLAVSGSIAAYKSAQVCRELIKKGANVKVLMTPDSVHFITPLTLATLSKNPVTIEYFDAKTGEWNNHVALAKWADIFLLAPATANTLSKMANAQSDNLLLATYLSMDNPQKVFFAPAMDLDMYQHPANQANIQKLQDFGHHLIPAESGELASGLIGEGRMAEIEHILSAIDENSAGEWFGKKILITAGPTYEAIDPVRFIGNHSSGKMGYALAKSALRRGASVTLVSGPVQLEKPKGVKVISVQSAAEMFTAVKNEYQAADCLIFAAAVADYRAEETADQKMKKKAEEMSIKLQPTEDILKYVGQHKSNTQFLVGFALETNNALENAKRKLKEKNLNMIVLNSLEDEGAGFGGNTNRISILDVHNNVLAFELKEKAAVAEDISDNITSRWLK